MTDAALRADVEFHLLAPNTWHRMLVTLVYRASDPYAIEATFPGTPTPRVWQFARDLLREGLTRPAGAGDVRLWPCRYGDGGLFLRLCNTPMEALFEVPRQQVVDFLARTEVLVPTGTETAHLHLDDIPGDLA